MAIGFGGFAPGRRPATGARLPVGDRGLEWFSAAVMLSWGLVLALPGDTLAQPSFAEFAQHGFTERVLAWVAGLIGALRLAALYVNGRSPRSPHVRVIGCLLGCLFWERVAWLLLAGTWSQAGVASVSAAVYALLGLADFLGIFRSAYDVRYTRR